MARDGELIEALSDKEHASWARWMAYLFSRCEQHSDGSMTIAAEAFCQHEQAEYVRAY